MHSRLAAWQRSRYALLLILGYRERSSASRSILRAMEHSTFQERSWTGCSTPTPLKESTKQTLLHKTIAETLWPIRWPSTYSRCHPSARYGTQCERLSLEEI